jgi:hypothetical protein
MREILELIAFESIDLIPHALVLAGCVAIFRHTQTSMRWVLIVSGSLLFALSATNIIFRSLSATDHIAVPYTTYIVWIGPLWFVAKVAFAVGFIMLGVTLTRKRKAEHPGAR